MEVYFFFRRQRPIRKVLTDLEVGSAAKDEMTGEMDCSKDHSAQRRLVETDRQSRVRQVRDQGAQAAAHAQRSVDKYPLITILTECFFQVCTSTLIYSEQNLKCCSILCYVNIAVIKKNY